MTQEEAKKFLMNKKVFVKNKSKEIQEKLFEIGFFWYTQPIKEPKHLTKPFLYIQSYQSLSYGINVNQFYEHKFEEISAEDILNIKVEYLPKTWEEFCKNNPINVGEVAPNSCSVIIPLMAHRTRYADIDKCSLPNSSAAKAHIALMQLHQLRDCYRGQVNPTLCLYSIMKGESDLIIVQDNNRFLSFPTKELAEEFLTNFKDLIEEAGDLI